MKQIWMAAVVVMATLVLPAGARAHEGHLHKVLGTIASIKGGQVGITTTAGKTLTVLLDKKTTITRGTAKLDAAALKVGERLSVDYTETNKIMTAQAIKLGIAPAVRK